MCSLFADQKHGHIRYKRGYNNTHTHTRVINLKYKYFTAMKTQAQEFAMNAIDSISQVRSTWIRNGYHHAEIDTCALHGGIPVTETVTGHSLADLYKRVRTLIANQPENQYTTPAGYICARIPEGNDSETIVQALSIGQLRQEIAMVA